MLLKEELTSGKMKVGKRIELLAPAKNLECGIEAIRHGADAVYIGPERFGARQAAGNSIEDIAALCDFAHRYWAKVYVTVNTILRDDELQAAEKLIWQLYEAGADALLVQDMAVMKMKLPPIALHASTQCDVRSVEKVKFLSASGFSRVVLARELSLAEIREIHEACPNVELECFVHGALCVSYSGQCYASQFCFGRSANRGECAQFCRLKFDLIDAAGHTLIRGKHLLSLRDMNRMQFLEEMMDAGVCSMKIEGRLKDVCYVKNIVAAYRQAIDRVMDHRPEYLHASSGNVRLTFEPSPEKSFNRGFTDYFLHGRNGDMFSFDTPKSVGEDMGIVSEVGRGWIRCGGKPFHNGDGLCYFDRGGELRGFRVNRVEGGCVYLYLESGQMPSVRVGDRIWRNQDAVFESMLSKESAVRRIDVDMEFTDTEKGFTLTLTDADGVQAVVSLDYAHEIARTPQDANIRLQLSKLGNTEFQASEIKVSLSGNWFVPSSILSDLRRQGSNALTAARAVSRLRPVRNAVSAPIDYPQKQLTYLGNVFNEQARSYYMNHGVTSVDYAFERQQPVSVPIMYCRHCLRYAVGACRKRQGQSDNAVGLTLPLYLKSGDGRRFELRFDCTHCQMLVLG